MHCVYESPSIDRRESTSKTLINPDFSSCIGLYFSPVCNLSTSVDKLQKIVVKCVYILTHRGRLNDRTTSSQAVIEYSCYKKMKPQWILSSKSCCLVDNVKTSEMVLSIFFSIMCILHVAVFLPLWGEPVPCLSHLIACRVIRDSGIQTECHCEHVARFVNQR